MGKIHRMDPHLANMIAAGEVVERPANIVKELLENSIDAGATRIEIELFESGMQSIRVSDNGSGMAEDDLLLAFERHATSKIQTEYDLFHIASLGFRGEALPSIAAVANVEITSSQDGSGGRMLSLHQGKIVKAGIASAKKGTSIFVSKLFYNTPARLKYLKSPQTELSVISEWVDKIALAFPAISFVLSNDGKTLLNTSGNGQLLEVILHVYGNEVAKRMVEFDHANRDYRIFGLFAMPSVSKSNRSSMTIIVNGRVIRNFKVNNAIIQAFGQLIPDGRFPILVLHIVADPSILDVNIHPTKQEIKFSEETRLLGLIQEALQSKLVTLTLIADHNPKTQNRAPFNELAVPVMQIQESIESIFASESTPSDASTIQNKVVSDQPIATNRIPVLNYIGQYAGTYLLFQNQEGLYLIDQHAAAERIRYERYRSNMTQRAFSNYELLLPLQVELPNHEYIEIDLRKSELEEFGIRLERNGPRSYFVRTVPDWFPRGSELAYLDGFFRQILDHKPLSRADVIDDLAILLSCKHSLKANHYVSSEEAEQLLIQLRECKQPFTCPHGRPVIVKLSLSDIEKWFRRITS
jgi:DNA mismatch repair protein MutL